MGPLYLVIGVSLLTLVAVIMLGMAARIFSVSYATSQNTEQIQLSLDRMKEIQKQLSSFDLDRETPRWKLAEKLLQEKPFHGPDYYTKSKSHYLMA